MAVGSTEPPSYARLLEGLGIVPVEGGDHLDPAHWPEEPVRFRAAFLTRTRDEWTEVFDAFDACVTRVLSPWEAHLQPHNAAHESLLTWAGRCSRRQRALWPQHPDTPLPIDTGAESPRAHSPRGAW